jgi:hypothetical protein
MPSDEICYRSNKISGVELLIAGVFRAISVRISAAGMDDHRAACRLVAGLGARALIGASLFSPQLTSKE